MQLWTYEHAVTLIPAMVGMLLLSLFLGWALRNQSRRVRMIPVQVVTLVLLVLEVGKQVLSYQRGYDLYHIPLHFCSLFLFVMPAMCLWRGKHAHKVDTVAAALCASVVLMMTVYPSLIYSDQNIREFFKDYFSFHTVFFHNLVVLLCFLLVTLKLYVPEKGDWKVLVWFMLIYGIIASITAQALQTNYNNFYTCNIPPLESLRLAVQAVAGYGVAQTLYVVIVILLDIGFVLMCRGILKLILQKRKNEVAV
jgi:hypothetical protein